VPLDTLDSSAVAGQFAGAQKPIYVICQTGTRAAKACDQLNAAGVSDVFNVQGGTTAWESAGLPVQRGSSGRMSIERQVRILAGSLVLVGVILTLAVRPGFIVVPALIGAGLVFAGLTDTCGMGILLAKMPWNR
jgi:3-mercaptopyruvate sulfurtransferase SseA